MFTKLLQGTESSPSKPTLHRSHVQGLLYHVIAYEMLRRKTDSSRYLAGTSESECVVCHETKDDSAFAPGLPKMCRTCNSGNPALYHTIW